MQNCRIIAVLAAVALAVSAFAAVTTVDKLLPGKTEIKPWAPVPDSLTYVKKNKLEDIYNGGANVYRDHGVQEAAQQLYQRGNEITEMSIMAIDTPAKAKKFYEYWKKDIKAAKVVVKTKNGEAFISKSNPVTGYVYAGRYLATVTPAYSGAKASKDTESALKILSKKLEKTVKK